MPFKPSIHVKVAATTQWVLTPVKVSARQRLRITATGTWANAGGKSPREHARWMNANGWMGVFLLDTLYPKAPLAALIGRIENNEPFFIGTNFQSTVHQDGRLFLSMNDVPGNFADNDGSVVALISVLPPINEHWNELVGVTLFMSADEVSALGKAGLTGGRVQLSQTSNGTAQLIVEKNGTSRWVMSYIVFGSLAGGMNIDAMAIDLPQDEPSIDQVLNKNTGGLSLLLQDLLSHHFFFVEKLRFRLNNINAIFDNDLTVRLAPGEVILDVVLHSSDPAIIGEGYVWTAAVFGFPIPLGWLDTMCPDVTMSNAIVHIHLKPELDEGQLHLQAPTVEFDPNFTVSILDSFFDDMKAKVKDKFVAQLQAKLRSEPTRTAVEKTLTGLLLQGHANAGVTSINIDTDGIVTQFSS